MMNRMELMMLSVSAKVYMVTLLSCDVLQCTAMKCDVSRKI